MQVLFLKTSPKIRYEGHAKKRPSLKGNMADLSLFLSNVTKNMVFHDPHKKARGGQLGSNTILLASPNRASHVQGANEEQIQALIRLLKEDHLRSLPHAHFAYICGTSFTLVMKRYLF